MVFIETTQMPTRVVGAVTLYSALILGDRAVGFGETVPLEIVTDAVQDFGRFLSLGWYSVFGSGIINDYMVRIDTA